MIIFDTLKIDSNNTLKIVCKIKDIEYYKDVYIDRILIDSADTYKNYGPSETPVYSKVFDGDAKTISLSLDSSDLDLDKQLLFVYVIAKGTPSPDTPCGKDNQTTVGVVCNLSYLYSMPMGYIKNIAQSCEIPIGFINYILQYNAFKYAILSKNYSLAVEYWNLFYKNNTRSITTKCGCHG